MLKNHRKNKCENYNTRIYDYHKTMLVISVWSSYIKDYIFYCIINKICNFASINSICVYVMNVHS